MNVEFRMMNNHIMNTQGQLTVLDLKL